MQVKGTALKTTRDFVQARYPERFNRWMDSLPQESADIYRNSIDATAWYSFKNGYAVPIQKVVEHFFNNDPVTGGEQLGRYSAEVALKGFYKVFLLIATPQFLTQRVARIFSTYFDPCNVEAYLPDAKTAVLRLTNFEEIDVITENRIAGWTCKALELSNCRGLTYDIKKSLTRGDDATEIWFMWTN